MDSVERQVTYPGDGHHDYSHRSSEDLKHDVEKTRAEMDATIDELVARLNPTDLLSRAFRSIFHGGSQAGRKGQRTASEAGRAIVDKIRDNPVPSAMVAIGAAWLLLSEREQTTDEVYDEAYAHDEAYAAEGTLEGVKRKAGEVRSEARARAGSAASALEETGREALHRARAGGRTAARRARQGARAAREGYEDAMERYPLAVGGAAMGLGLLSGLLIPETRLEHETLGPVRDAAMETAGSVVQDVAEAAGQQARQEGLSPEDLAEKAKRVAERAGEEAEQQTHAPRQPR